MASYPTIATAAISQTFNNYRPDLYSGDGKHKGVDYAVPVGTPVYSCLNGIVIFAGVVSSGYGRHVIIRHGEVDSYYGHLSSYSVAVGQPIEAGQQIGKSGGDPHDNINGDGNTTGAHLHWEIRPAGAKSDQQAIDPMAYCLKTMTGGADAQSRVVLNVRSAPNTNATVLYTLQVGQKVTVMEQAGGWARLKALRPEWCSAEYLSITSSITDTEKLRRLWDAHPELH